MQEILADLPAGGGYLSVAKSVVLLVLTVPWLYVAPWVHKDAKRVRAPQQMWCMLVMGSGALGVLIWLVLPIYAIGLLAYLVLTGSALLAYVFYRNGRVGEDEKVLTGSHFASLLARQKRESVQAVTRVKLYGKDGKIRHPPDAETAEADEVKAYNLVQDLLYDAIWRRASDADLIPTQTQMEARLLIDGVATKRPGIDIHDGEALIQYLKAIAELDPEDRRRPQKGAISVDLGSKRIDVQVATAGTTSGQRLQLRIVQEAVRTKLDELGMSADLLKRIREQTQTHGILLVSAPPRSGLTSTLYSLLREHDAFMKQLVTMEAKVGIELENITQHAYGADADLAEALAPVLRRDPDVVMIDTCPDAATAEQILQAAKEKILLVGMIAGDSFSALAKWVKTCGSAAAVQDLRGVLCQILLRKLCPRCREAYKPDPQLLAKANLPADKIDKFYRPASKPPLDEKGRPIVCATCQGTGYFERTAAFELLEMTDGIRKLVVGGSTIREIKAACRKNKMLYLQEQALRKVIAGETSVQEVLRVSQSLKKKK